MSPNIPPRKDCDPTIIVMRQAALFLVRLIAKTKITPNQVTLAHFIIFTPSIVYFLVQGTYQDNLIALFLIFWNAFFDLVDGALARIKSLQSKLGYWLDGGLDKIFHYALLSATIVGVVQGTNNPRWYLVGLIMLFGQTMANFIGNRYEVEFGFDGYSGSLEFNRQFSNREKISLLDAFLKNIIVPTKLIYIFFFTCRYLLILALLFDRLDLFLIIFTTTINIRWLTMYLLYLRYLSNTPSKLYTIQSLKKLATKNKVAHENI